MHCVTIRPAGHVHQFVDTKVTFARRSGTNRIGLVCKPHMQRVSVHFTKHGDGSDAQLTTGPKDAHGDFAAIRNQDFLEHRKAEREKSLAWRPRRPLELLFALCSLALFEKLL